MRQITQLDELKKIELEIMKKIHQFCEENSINYTLSYGTLLGAVRHKGFIPWDDDIDLWLPRSDYDKFLRTFPEYGKAHNLKIVNHTTTPYYGRPMSKVIDDNTVLTEAEFKGDEPIGVFVDLWPVDGLPDDPKQRKKFIKKRAYYLRLYYVKIKKIKYVNGFKKKILTFFAKPLGMFYSRRKLLAKLNAMFTKYPYGQCNTVGCLCDMSVLELDKSCLENRVLLDFEDSKFYAPEQYDKVLTGLFGDYMQPPPEDKRTPHHIVQTYYKQ